MRGLGGQEDDTHNPQPSSAELAEDGGAGGRSAHGALRVLFVHSRKARFVEIDRELLARRWQVEDWYQPGRWANPLAVLARVWRCDLIFGWFASWHTFWPITLAWLLRKPSVLITGGFDTASMPEIGYGFQTGGLRRVLSRWVIHRASALVTNSHYSLDEIERNLGLGSDRVTVVPHGIPDAFGSMPDKATADLVLTVGVVDRSNLLRKGLRPFVHAAAELPDVPFVVAGRWDDDAIGDLRRDASDNVRFTGWLPDDELDELFRRGSVYVQPSRHEGFGMSVAEAMLAGCIPVVTRAGALPEVVADVGIQLETADPHAIATAVRRALEMGPEARQRARDRVLERFNVEQRRQGLWSVIDRLVARQDRSRRRRRLRIHADNG